MFVQFNQESHINWS